MCVDNDLYPIRPDMHFMLFALPNRPRNVTGRGKQSPSALDPVYFPSGYHTVKVSYNVFFKLGSWELLMSFFF